MSSATSTDRAPSGDSSFRPWHFFAVGALAAATAGVLLSDRNAPEHLIMLSVAILAAGIAATAAYHTLAPLVARRRPRDDAPLGRQGRAALEREKMLVLRSIKELEFDRAMGKVAASDFAEMSQRLKARALRLMKQLDEGGAAARARVERELEERLGQAPLSPHPNPVPAPRQVRGALSPSSLDEARDDPEALEGSKGASGERGRIVCASCETANDADARFCKGCGSPLAGAE